MDALGDDLVALILRNNIGLWTFVQCSAVSKRVYEICRSDESVLISAALYTGGLTKTNFVGLFAFSPSECKRYPNTATERSWDDGVFYLYRADAIEKAVHAVGGVAGWRARIATRAPLVRKPRAPSWKPFGKRVRRRQWELEEDLHWQTRNKRAPVPIGYTACLP